MRSKHHFDHDLPHHLNMWTPPCFLARVCVCSDCRSATCCSGVTALTQRHTTALKDHFSASPKTFINHNLNTSIISLSIIIYSLTDWHWVNINDLTSVNLLCYNGEMHWIHSSCSIMGSYWVILTQWASFSVLLVSRLRMADVWITWEGSGSLEPRSPSVPDEPDSCIIHSGPDPFHYWDEPRCEGYTVIEFDQLGPALLYTSKSEQHVLFLLMNFQEFLFQGNIF